jgi:hypothetical protein
MNLTEWMEPGIGLCSYWQAGEIWYWSTPRHQGTCTSLAECMAELQAIIEPDPYEFSFNQGRGE